MMALKFISGLIFFAIGWVLWFRPQSALAIHRFMREIVFSDRVLLLYGRKLAVLYFCLAFLAMYMAWGAFNAHPDATRPAGTPHCPPAAHTADRGAHAF